MSEPGVAVITGASAGIGRATAAALAAEGFELVLGARREDLLREVAEPLGARAVPLDVTDPASIEAFAAQVPEANLLVNNAGGAYGRAFIEESDEQDWIGMWELNVMGVLRVTRRFLPLLRASGRGHIVNMGSVAGFEAYPSGAGYTASKHALRAMTRTLRAELLGEPIRVTEISPGLVNTEFSLVRFGGDRQKADAVYRGLTPLVAEDIADAIAWAVTRPPHVNVDEIVIRPRDQASSWWIHREG